MEYLSHDFQDRLYNKTQSFISKEFSYTVYKKVYLYKYINLIKAYRSHVDVVIIVLLYNHVTRIIMHDHYYYKLTEQWVRSYVLSERALC